jgi:hypothetical protein
MATQAVHAQCASEWQQYSAGRAGAIVTAGPSRSRWPSPGATRAYSTTRACPGRRAPYSFTAGPGTSASPPISTGPAATRRRAVPSAATGGTRSSTSLSTAPAGNCAGRDMAQRRGRPSTSTPMARPNLRVIFSELPAGGTPGFAIKTFGIPQFTKASWQIKAARLAATRRRGRRRRRGRDTSCWT